MKNRIEDAAISIALWACYLGFGLAAIRFMFMTIKVHAAVSALETAS